jgi:hypothetical protein
VTEAAVFYKSHFGEDVPDAVRRAFGPATVAKMVRQAVKICWVIAPKDQRALEYVEAEIKRLTERALEEFGEDGKGFQVGEPK